MMYVKNKVEFVPHLYTRTAGLLLIYSLLIENGRRFISSTVLFSPVDRLFKMANNTVLRGGYTNIRHSSSIAIVTLSPCKTIARNNNQFQYRLRCSYYTLREATRGNL